MGVSAVGKIRREGCGVCRSGILCAHALMFVSINFKQSGKEGFISMWHLSNDLEEVRDGALQICLFLIYFAFITIHQEVFVSGIIRNQEGQASDERD